MRQASMLRFRPHAKLSGRSQRHPNESRRSRISQSHWSHLGGAHIVKRATLAKALYKASHELECNSVSHLRASDQPTAHILLSQRATAPTTSAHYSKSVDSLGILASDVRTKPNSLRLGQLLSVLKAHRPTNFSSEYAF